jgi:AraC family transcriptional regulator of adaptative response/methylated-DNA-[protein]-cysteine methyltransferase
MTETNLPTTRAMYQALAARDAGYDGVFFAAVRTTGIFCRPTCTAKKPKPDNVEFFASTHDALLAGYRPCKRCHPLEPNGKVPSWLRPLMVEVERNPARRWKDADLRQMSLDPSRVRRWFRHNHGMTFHAYQRARRLGLALGQLRHGDTLSNTAYEHGYESLSGFRDAFERFFGELPGRTRDSVLVKMTRILTPLGPMVAGATSEGICLLEFADRPMLETQIKRLRKTLDCVFAPGSNEHIDQLDAQLERYFAGTLAEFTVPLIVPGTDFQRAAWDYLRGIPYGETRTYRDEARAIGSPGAQRAIGRANGDNRVAIVIPCHRVVGADGQLSGYGGGLWRKRCLLDHERQTRGHARSAAVTG